MSAALPKQLERYIIAGKPGDSIRAVTAAVERGEFGYDVLKELVSAIAKGREPRFAKTKPVPARILEYIRSSGLPPMQAVWVGHRDGLWSYEDAATFVENNEALSQAKVKPEARGVYLTRGRRALRKLPKTEGMFVPKMSLDALLSDKVCDGAKACLALILSKAGKDNVLVTYTLSLATQLGRTARTVRNYFAQLEAAGLIKRMAGKHPNTVKIEIKEECRPDPYKEPLDVAAFKLARKSQNPVIRKMAETVTLMFWNAHRADLCPEGRRKEISVFNPDSNPYGLTANEGEAQPRPIEPPTTHSTLYRQIPKGSLRQVRHPLLHQSAGIPSQSGEPWSGLGNMRG